MNKNRKIEVWVGLFMAMGFVALFYLAMQVSNLGTAYTGETFDVTARFDNIGGFSGGDGITERQTDDYRGTGSRLAG